MPEEVQESSEVIDETPVVEESAPQAEPDGAEKQEAAPEKEQEATPVPFHQQPLHEHPRFKEVIEERRAFKEQLDQTRGYIEAMQKEMQALRSQAPNPAAEVPKYKPLIEQLKAINPEFAEFQEGILTKLEQAEKRAAIAEETQKDFQSYKEREFQNNVKSSIQSLYEANKLPQSVRERYDAEMQAIAFREQSSGVKHTLADANRIFNLVHKQYSDFLESYKRDTLKGYVQAKTQDITPTPQTGGAATSSKTKLIAANDEQGQIKWLANQLRAAKKI